MYEMSDYQHHTITTFDCELTHNQRNYHVSGSATWHCEDNSYDTHYGTVNETGLVLAEIDPSVELVTDNGDSCTIDPSDQLEQVIFDHINDTYKQDAYDHMGT